jgi:hypothetical protein
LKDRLKDNFEIPHQSLNGKTPAEIAGINLNLNDGWGDLIELATKHQAINGITPNHTIGEI